MHLSSVLVISLKLLLTDNKFNYAKTINRLLCTYVSIKKLITKHQVMSRNLYVKVIKLTQIINLSEYMWQNDIRRLDDNKRLDELEHWRPPWFVSHYRTSYARSSIIKGRDCSIKFGPQGKLKFGYQESVIELSE